MRIAHLSLSSGVALAAITLALSAHAQTSGSGGGLPPFSWTGPYFGVNGGYDVRGSTVFDDTTGALPNNSTALQLGLRPGSDAVHTGGIVGGAQIGYNFEVGAVPGLEAFGGGLVAGAEADADYTDIRRTDTVTNTTNFGPLDIPTTTANTRVNQFQGELRYLGTVRGRIGVAYRNALIYGTGGAAYGDVLRHLTYYGPNSSTPFFAGSNDGMKWGYAYGGGVELAVPTHTFLSRFNFFHTSFFHTSGATLKIEYLRYDLGSDEIIAQGINGGAGLGAYTTRVRTNGEIARAGLNYKF